MKRDDDKRRLYIGFDESNHGKFPEIITGASSIIEADAIMGVIHGKKRMTEWELIKYFVNKNRDFVYTQIEEKQFAKDKNSLIESVPYLVNSLVARLATKNKRFDSIKLIIDGGGKTREIRRLDEGVKLIKGLTHIKEVVYNFFPKSDICSYKYSPILKVADGLAHYFFRKSSLIEKINTPGRMIELNT